MALNPQQQQLIINALEKSKKQDESQLSRYRLAKENLRNRRSLWINIRSGLFMTLGIFSAGFGLEGFLIPNGLIDGGVTGISLLTNGETGIPFSILILLFNIPFILLGWKQIGKGFSIKSIVCITMLAIVVEFVHYPIVTNDKVLIAVFGGFFPRCRYRTYYSGRGSD